MHDVAIIGAGPAGCAAAIALRRLGRSVLLVEQHRFPRDKACGECLSALGIQTLEQLGVAGQIRRLGPANLSRAILYAQNGSSCELPLPRTMWGISRRTLDAAMLQAARDAGAQILQPARCEAIQPGSVPRFRVRDPQDNRLRDIASRVLIVADGKGALWHPRPSGDLGIKAHFEGIDAPDDAITLFGVRGHYGGIASIEVGRWNRAFSIPASMAAHCRGDLDRLMSRVFDQNPALQQRMHLARRIEPWLASPLPRFAVHRRWPTNVIPIGNAAAALEPIGGEGMGLALHSAVLAATWIDRGLKDPQSDWASTLHSEMTRLWRGRRLACRAAGIMLSLPVLSELMVAVASAGSGVTKLAMRAMGKTDCAAATFA